MSTADLEAVRAEIDSDELLDLALTLGNIPSRSGHERAAADFVFDWMEREGFGPRRVGATEDRPNVIGEYGGGRGPSLLFTAHLDTESPTRDPDLDRHRYSEATLRNPEWEQCWVEDGTIRGYPVANDRGPMSCFLIAAKALRSAGIDLAGTVYLTACPGEIGPEPIEEFRGVEHLGKDIGAHYLFHHGGVAPDYAISAEGCDFGLTWVGSGYALVRLRLRGEGVFTPLLEHPADVHQHPNPIYRLGPLLESLNAWSREYEVRNRYDGPGGVAIPKCQVAAVRGGLPRDFGAGTEICDVWFEIGLTPAQRIGTVIHDLRGALDAVGLRDVEIEPSVVRNGFAADALAVGPLVAAVDDATKLTRGHAVELADPVYSSMWRDHNVFNMQRVPALTTGFVRWRPTPADLVDSALIYALTTLAICGRSAPAGG